MSGTKSYWTGPQHGRWIPTAWEPLREAVTQGHLDEKRWVEIKEQLGTGTKANLELARDLAALALEGGLLVIGVRDEATTGDDVVGVEHPDEVRDRVDQVSRTRISPALHVDTQTIPHPDDPGRGVLLVQVPNTGPHQADHRYWGRSDTGKRPLSDTEVRDHLARQQHARIDIQAELSQRVSDLSLLSTDDPGLHILVCPNTAPPECLTEFLAAFDAARIICNMTIASAARSPKTSRPHSFVSGTDPTREVGRIRLSFQAPESPRPHLAEIGEDGRVFVSNNQMGHQDRSRPGGPYETLWTAEVLASVEDAVAVAGELGERASYHGSWQVAVQVTNLAGVRDDWAVTYGVLVPGPCTDRDYAGSAGTSTSEMATEPWAVAEKLLAPLLRGLSADKTYLPYRPGSDAPGLRAQT
jgi:Putative DNA-binding domain